MDLVQLIAQSLWFLLPGYIANVAPILVSRTPVMDYPLDFGLSYHGTRILGSHKTFRGLVFGVGAGLIVAYLQYEAVPFESLLFADVLGVHWITLGFLLGFGALLGDAVESFFKRRAGVQSGKAWVPWDQLDYVIGMLLCVSLVFLAPLPAIAIMLVGSVALHFVFSYIGYLLGYKDDPV